MIAIRLTPELFLHADGFSSGSCTLERNWLDLAVSDDPKRVSTREQNERKFVKWEALPKGGRRYWLDVKGRQGWVARYVKDVNAEEITIRFAQEIYAETGSLVEVHEKYPVDLGHKGV